MAASMSSADLREVRGLAQKLFGQCRDSPSLYKNLANDVRRLRNSLEDVEDQFADDKIRSQKEIRVLEGVWACRVVLTELDWTLQSFRCSTYKWQDVKPDTIGVLKKKIVTADEELAEAFVNLKKGEDGEGRGGDNAYAVQLVAKDGVAWGSQSVLAENDSGLKSPLSGPDNIAQSPSQDSPPIPQDIPLPASPPRIHRLSSDEKEVYAADSSPNINSAVGFHNPFAERDPLSMDIRSASAFLSGVAYQAVGGAEDSDDDIEPILTSSGANQVRNSMKPCSFGVATTRNPGLVQTPVAKANERRSDDISDRAVSQTRVVEEQIIEERSIHDIARVAMRASPYAGSYHITGSQQAPEPPPEEASHKATSLLTQTASDTQPEIATKLNERISDASPLNAQVPPQPGSEHGICEHKGDVLSRTEHVRATDSEPHDDVKRGEHLMTPKVDSTTLDVLPVRTYMSQPASSKASSEDVSAPSRADSKVEVSDSCDLQHRVSIPDEKLRSVVKETSIVGDEQDQDSLVQGRGDGNPTQSLVAQNMTASLSQAPKPPSRKPPPPPPRRGNDNTSKKRSRFPYRIVNPSPPTRSNTDASEDLYSSSRPTSLRLAQTQASSHGPRTVPEVIIDKSALEHRPNPPQVPKRPTRYPARLQPRLSTRRATTGVPHIATMLKPEVREGAAADHEIDGKLSSRRSDIGLNPRKSVDETLGVNNSLLGPSDGSFQRSRSVSAPERQRSRSVSDLSAAAGPRPPASQQPIRSAYDAREYYSHPALDLNSNGVDVGAERITRICQCWNSQYYNEAEAYLMGHLESLIDTKQAFPAQRRVRHLLGVCLSFKGEFERALAFFVSVLRAPITDPSELDAGDCAAAYWLGDTYALLNRRTEALLAYCMAEQGEAVRNSPSSGLQNCLDADQQAVQLGVSKADFKVRWAQESLANREAPEDTILSPRIITQHAAKICLELKPRSFRHAPMTLAPDQSRAALLFSLDRSKLDMRHYQRLTLTAEAFAPHTSWPMPYDPLFVMANVSRGRLIAYECDLLDVFEHNSEARVPKSGPLSTSRMSCFTCNDLTWLIRTIRKCLETMDMKWSEVANVEGVWFLVRQTLMQDKIATVHYFSIALFRQSLRSGYGVEVCPDGVGSARLIRMTLGFVNGVPQGVEKGTRKFIKDFLESEYKVCAKTEKGTVLPKRRSLLKSKPIVAELDGAPSVAALGSKARVERMEVMNEGLQVVGEAGAASPPPPLPPRPSGEGRSMRSEDRIERRNIFNRGYGSAMVAHATRVNK